MAFRIKAMFSWSNKRTREPDTTMVSPQDNDPRPVPPPLPDINDCCGNGCDPCVFDVYEDALDRYKRELRAWHDRRARSTTGQIEPPG